MSGQMKTFEEKQRMMDEFIEKTNPYKESEPLRFDLRGYAEYIKKNNIKSDMITEDIMALFAL